jgi:hypothetical protein
MLPRIFLEDPIRTEGDLCYIIPNALVHSQMIRLHVNRTAANVVSIISLAINICEYNCSKHKVYLTMSTSRTIGTHSCLPSCFIRAEGWHFVTKAVRSMLTHTPHYLHSPQRVPGEIMQWSICDSSTFYFRSLGKEGGNSIKLFMFDAASWICRFELEGGKLESCRNYLRTVIQSSLWNFAVKWKEICYYDTIVTTFNFT